MIRNFPIFSTILLMLVLVSCKKNKAQLLDDQIEKEYRLSFLYNKKAVVSLKRERMESTTDGIFFYATGGQNPEEYNKFLYSYNSKTEKWKEIPLSIPRNESKIISLKGKVFVAGGWHGQLDFHRIDIYDQKTETITVKLLEDTQSGSNINVTIVNNRYVVFLSYNFFHIYDNDLNQWKTINIDNEDMNYVGSVTTIGNQIYIRSYYNLDSLWVFDFNNYKFSNIPSKALRSNGNIVSKGDIIYFYSSNLYGRTDIIDFYNIKENVWGQIKMPEPRDFYNLVIDEKSNNIIVTGGRMEDKGGLNVNISNDLLVYNTVDKSWERFSLKSPRIFHTAKILNRELIVFGGLSDYYIEKSTHLESENYEIKYLPSVN